MKPERIPREILDVFLQLWADEGFDVYWKVSAHYYEHQGARILVVTPGGGELK